MRVGERVVTGNVGVAATVGCKDRVGGSAIGVMSNAVGNGEGVPFATSFPVAVEHADKIEKRSARIRMVPLFDARRNSCENREP